MTRDDTNETWVTNEPGFTFELPETFISSGNKGIKFTSNWTMDQGENEILEVSEEGVFTIGNILPKTAGYF